MPLVRFGPPTSTMPLAIALLAVDAGFLVLHIARQVTAGDATPSGGFLASPMWSLHVDGGYGEWFGYGKAVFAAVTFAAVHRWSRETAYLSWALVFGAFALDDAFMLRERVGARLARSLELTESFGLRPLDQGELIVSAVLGALLAAALIAGHLHAGTAARRDAVGLTVIVAALLGFGVVLDMVGGLFSGWLYLVIGTVEDAGELAMLSVVAVAAQAIARRRAWMVVPSVHRQRILAGERTAGLAR